MIVDACDRGDVAAVRFLLAQGAEVAVEDHLALRQTCRDGSVEIATLLLAHGADVSARNQEPLRHACRRGNAALVQLLLAHGARVTPGMFGTLLSRPHVSCVQAMVRNAYAEGPSGAGHLHQLCHAHLPTPEELAVLYDAGVDPHGFDVRDTRLLVPQEKARQRWDARAALLSHACEELTGRHLPHDLTHHISLGCAFL